MNNVVKARRLIEEIYPSESLGDYGLKEMLVLEAMKWKDEIFEEILDGWYDWAKANCRSNVSFTDMSNFVRFMRESWDKPKKVKDVII